MEMSSKKVMIRVESLKAGDQFAFLNPHMDETAAPTMVVIRSPAVNPIANSCHFRYQPKINVGSEAKANVWQDNQSWNGALGVLVRLVDGPPTESTNADASPAAAVSRKKK
jgi:hypothetical protein